ncbi:hypothetical protein DL93DRAFT_2166640 [Clavulina sp. PMI_390]|nr:hypothetical protein DL93DRAFT_2166640 [Clavulina sp. PMI_390]
MVQLHRSFSTLALLATLIPTISAAAVTKLPPPGEVALSYPQDGPIARNDSATFRWEINTGSLGGLYFTYILYFILPSGDINFAGPNFYDNPSSPPSGKAPVDCTHPDAGGLVFLPQVGLLDGGSGTYTAVWNFTYTFPTSVDTSGDSIMCLGLGSSETFVLQRQFTVVDNVPQASTVPNVNVTSTFASTPTGTAYKITSSARKGLSNGSNHWLNAMLCLALINLTATWLA